jgi:hypothetical protein
MPMIVRGESMEELKLEGVQGRIKIMENVSQKIGRKRAGRNNRRASLVLAISSKKHYSSYLIEISRKSPGP